MLYPEYKKQDVTYNNCKKHSVSRKEKIMAYLGEEIRKLGFGLMRLPQKDGAIDIEETKAMVDEFMAAGFTYFDTAWAYAGSEDAIRQALVERYPREKFQLATKNAAWINCRTREEAIAQFDTSLKQTGAGYFDFYLLHNLGESRTQFFDKYDMWSWVLEKKKEGLVKHVGFSFHSTPEELEEILNAHPEMEFVQLQINYADWENPAVQSRACYEVARKHGKPVVIMEPVKGGMLATPPESVEKILKDAEPESSAASWAIRFAADLEGVITVLSGMSSLEQMKDNLSYMKDFRPLNEEEQTAIKKAQEAFHGIKSIPCTACHYCTSGCPQEIPIPEIFAARNKQLVWGQLEEGKNTYLKATAQGSSASDCIACGQCESACPQQIPVIQRLKECAEAFGH